jgi:hypothetical protein
LVVGWGYFEEDDGSRRGVYFCICLMEKGMGCVWIWV